jgi:hypothetical protein
VSKLSKWRQQAIQQEKNASARAIDDTHIAQARAARRLGAFDTAALDAIASGVQERSRAPGRLPGGRSPGGGNHRLRTTV